MSALFTSRPRDGRPVILYDGNCAFCFRSSRELERLAGGSAHVRRVSFQVPHALDEFPGVTQGACMQAMHVVLPSGRVVRGAEAVARIIECAPYIGVIALLYYVPLLRMMVDWAYATIARRRYTLFMRKVGCMDGTCRIP